MQHVGIGARPVCRMLTALDARELAIAVPIALSFQPFAYNVRRYRNDPPIQLIKLTPSSADLLFEQWVDRLWRVR